MLDLKVCDPAMGSGAFLVEACRQLGDGLAGGVAACTAGCRGCPPTRTPELFARRLVAQRCLYGVDKNPFAVDLAKLSLWLVTLAKDHPFTFLDHALRHGDSLVGLTREQIRGFHWRKPRSAHARRQAKIAERIEAAERLRRIEAMGDSDDGGTSRGCWARRSWPSRTCGWSGTPLAAAFFAGDKPKKREATRDELGLGRGWRQKR